jgi:dolichyl-phosphate beta-glucosyltransferase
MGAMLLWKGSVREKDVDMAERESVTIVVPCYNEEKRFKSGKFSEYATGNRNIKFVLVNDGSSDNTADLLAELVEKDGDKFFLLNLPRNQGKAEAVRQGFLHALKFSESFIGYWDADLATPLDAIQDFLSVFRERPNLKLVMGSRVKLLGHVIERNEYRHYFGRLFATFAAITLNREVYDTQCGAKLFKVFPSILSLFDKPFSSRWLFDVELIARLIKLEDVDRKKTGGVIFEYPLYQWVDDGLSRVKIADFAKAPYELAKIRLKIGKL